MQTPSDNKNPLVRGHSASKEFLLSVNIKPLCTSCRNFLGHIDATQTYKDDLSKAEIDSELHASYFSAFSKYEQDINESPNGYVKKTSVQGPDTVVTASATIAFNTLIISAFGGHRRPTRRSLVARCRRKSSRSTRTGQGSCLGKSMVGQ